MSIAGAQDLWIAGARFYFQRDPITVAGSPVVQPIIDLGTLRGATPSFSTNDQTLYDGDGGVLRPIAVTRTKFDESYDIKTNNFNMDNLALLFSASPPTDFTQAATPIGPVVHDVSPGRLVKLHDANGIPIYGVASIGTIQTVVGSTALVAGVDYEFVNPERGFIRILSGSSVVTADAQINVTFTPRAISSSKRLVNPQTGGCVATGTGLLFWGRCGNNQQTVREARFALAPTNMNTPEDNYGDWSFKATVLNDPTKLTAPAGRLLYWLGNMPSLS